MQDDQHELILLDFSQFSPWINNGGAIISPSEQLLEKTRWSRCSYGRKSNAVVKVAANGRISELQCSFIYSHLQHLVTNE